MAQRDLAEEKKMVGKKTKRRVARRHCSAGKWSDSVKSGYLTRTLKGQEGFRVEVERVTS